MKRSLVIAVMAVTLMGLPGQPLAAMRSDNSEVIGKIQQVHRLVGRAMSMVTEGAGLVLVANMDLAPPTDKYTAERGMTMIQEGEDIVRTALAGEGMDAGQRKVMMDDPMMKTAQGLSESILRYVEIVQGMKLTGSVERKLQLHQVHLMVNHSLDMAAEGANLVMLGDLDLAEQLDKYTVERGRMMLKDARETLSGVSESDSMEGMRQGQKGSMGDAMMTRTEELIDTAHQIIDALERMSR